MLLPFEFAILTLDEVRTLVAYLTAATKRTRGGAVKMEPAVLEVYRRLQEFIARGDHYEHTLRSFDPADHHRHD